MAHHEGMTLLALAYAVLDRPMQRRFAAAPSFLADRAAAPGARAARAGDLPAPRRSLAGRVATGRQRARSARVPDPNTPAPEVHLLSNGHYHVAITNAGGGYSRWRELAVTRWHEDPTRDCWGTFGYLRDVTPERERERGAPAPTRAWSIAHQPTLVQGTSYEAIFSQGRAELRRVDHDIDTTSRSASLPRMTSSSAGSA